MEEAIYQTGQVVSKESGLQEVAPLSSDCQAITKISELEPPGQASNTDKLIQRSSDVEDLNINTSPDLGHISHGIVYKKDHPSLASEGGKDHETCKKCDEKMPSSELKNHMENTCNYRVVDCDFRFAGCDFQGPKINMAMHIQDNMSKHLLQIADSLKEENLSRSQEDKHQCHHSKNWTVILFAVFLVISVMMSSIASVVIYKALKPKDNGVTMNKNRYELVLSKNLHDEEESKADTEQKEAMSNLMEELQHMKEKFNDLEDLKETIKELRLREEEQGSDLEAMKLKMKDLKALRFDIDEDIHPKLKDIKQTLDDMRARLGGHTRDIENLKLKNRG